MTELITTSRLSAPSARGPAAVTAGPGPQLSLGTAAALTAAPAAHPHLASAWGVVRGLWHSDHESVHHHYPQRFTYLESAMLSRELDRL